MSPKNYAYLLSALLAMIIIGVEAYWVYDGQQVRQGSLRAALVIEPEKEVYSVGERVYVNFYLENKNRYPIELDSYFTAGVAHFKPDNAPIFIYPGVFYTPAGRTFMMPPGEKYTIHREITFRCKENMIGDYMIKLVMETAGGDVSKVKTIKIVAED